MPYGTGTVRCGIGTVHYDECTLSVPIHYRTNTSTISYRRLEPWSLGERARNEPTIAGGHARCFPPPRSGRWKEAKRGVWRRRRCDQRSRISRRHRCFFTQTLNVQGRKQRKDVLQENTHCVGAAARLQGKGCIFTVEPSRPVIIDCSIATTRY